MNHNNQIQEQDINTRKELWDSLFLFVNFQGLKAEYPNMWNKDYRILPLPKSYQTTREKLTKYYQGLNHQLETLINSFNPYFQSNIYPIIKEHEKTLSFRADRLLKNKIIGESSSLFNDLIIWEIEYRQVEKFKELLKKIWREPEEGEDLRLAQIMKDAGNLIKGKINHSVSQRFILKWDKTVKENIQGGDLEEWQDLAEYLKQWEQGKGAESQWKTQLDIFKEQIETFFLLGSENISDGQPFFQLGKVKQDDERGLVIATQNRKGFTLNNPYLFVINFHQKYFRVYAVENYSHINPRNLYVELNLREDWVWKEYPSIVHSLGSMQSSNHPIYHGRNLPDN